MKFEELIFQVRDSIAVITLNRPNAVNSLNLSIREELYDALKEVENDSNIRVAIITGAGDRSFCAGGDIKTMKNIEPLGGRDRLKRLHRVTLSMVEMEKPIIAAVNGYATGGGCNLALAADLIIASERARFAQSFARIGVISDMGGLYFLPRKIGMSKTKDLLFSGRMVSASEAKEIGLVDSVVPHEKLMNQCMDTAKQICSAPPRVIGLMKMMLRESANMTLRSVLEMEAQVQDILFQSEDHREAVKAFLEKRDPRFVGR